LSPRRQRYSYLIGPLRARFSSAVDGITSGNLEGQNMTDVLTYHVDISRTGLNPNFSFAAGSTWRRYVTLPTKAPARGAPLYLAGYTFPAGPHAGETHDLLIVAASDNVVYAYAEDQLLKPALFWSPDRQADHGFTGSSRRAAGSAQRATSCPGFRNQATAGHGGTTSERQIRCRNVSPSWRGARIMKPDPRPRPESDLLLTFSEDRRQQR
jgi:hypothetical protein